MHYNIQASSDSNREGTRSQDTPPFDFPRLEVLISICQDWFSDCYFMNVVLIFWTNMTVCICIWIVRYVYSMTIIKYWHIRWITPNSILMVLLKGILSEFVYWEQEWEGILFPGFNFIPTLGRVPSENMVASRLDQSQCRRLSIAQLVELGSCELIHCTLAW